MAGFSPREHLITSLKASALPATGPLSRPSTRLSQSSHLTHTVQPNPEMPSFSKSPFAVMSTDLAPSSTFSAQASSFDPIHQAAPGAFSNDGYFQSPPAKANVQVPERRVTPFSGTDSFGQKQNTYTATATSPVTAGLHQQAQNNYEPTAAKNQTQQEISSFSTHRRASGPTSASQHFRVERAQHHDERSASKSLRAVQEADNNPALLESHVPALVKPANSKRSARPSTNVLQDPSRQPTVRGQSLVSALGMKDAWVRPSDRITLSQDKDSSLANNNKIEPSTVLYDSRASNSSATILSPSYSTQAAMGDLPTEHTSRPRGLIELTSEVHSNTQLSSISPSVQRSFSPSPRSSQGRQPEHYVPLTRYSNARIPLPSRSKPAVALLEDESATGMSSSHLLPQVRDYDTGNRSSPTALAVNGHPTQYKTLRELRQIHQKENSNYSTTIPRGRQTTPFKKLRVVNTSARRGREEVSFSPNPLNQKSKHPSYFIPM